MNLSNNDRQVTKSKKSGFSRRAFKRCGALTLAVSSFLFLAACQSATEQRVEQVGGVTARQVIENPSAYVGKTVTVSGDVEEVWNPRAFNMDSGLTSGELLVIGREPFPNAPDRGSNTAVVVSDVATVTGVVRMFVTAEIEREIGWDLDARIEAEFNAKPVLIAQSVNFKPNANRSTVAPMNLGANQTGSGAMNANQTNGAMNSNQMSGAMNSNQMTANTAAGTGNVITDVGVYAATADKLSLAGRPARLTNARVARIVGPRTFTVASGSDEFYVMLDDESAKGVGTQGAIQVGNVRDINGVFQRLEAAEINDMNNRRFRPLTQTERDYLRRTEIYLLADQVSPAK